MRDLIIRWLLRDSLLSYMQRDSGFEIDAEGGARFNEAGEAVLPAVQCRDGVVRATGSLILRAHGGALSVSLVGLTIAGSDLWVTATDGADVATEGRRLRLATLVPTELPDVFDARLAPEADAHFLYNYVPGTDFGRLRFAAA